MKQQISAPILMGVVAVIVLIVGFIGWQVFGTHDGGGGTAEQLKAAQSRKNKRDGG